MAPQINDLPSLTILVNWTTSVALGLHSTDKPVLFTDAYYTVAEAVSGLMVSRHQTPSTLFCLLVLSKRFSEKCNSLAVRQPGDAIELVRMLFILAIEMTGNYLTLDEKLEIAQIPEINNFFHLRHFLVPYLVSSYMHADSLDIGREEYLDCAHYFRSPLFICPTDRIATQEVVEQFLYLAHPDSALCHSPLYDLPLRSVPVIPSPRLFTHTSKLPTPPSSNTPSSSCVHCGNLPDSRSIIPGGAACNSAYIWEDTPPPRFAFTGTLDWDPREDPIILKELRRDAQDPIGRLVLSPRAADGDDDIDLDVESFGDDEDETELAARIAPTDARVSCGLGS